METPKKFVLLCIDNEINRYEQVKPKNEDEDIQIKTIINALQEFRHNIEYNL